MSPGFRCHGRSGGGRQERLEYKDDTNYMLVPGQANSSSAGNKHRCGSGSVADMVQGESVVHTGEGGDVFVISLQAVDGMGEVIIHGR